MPRVPEKLRKERRDSLVATALNQFLKKGYDNTTIDNIIDELKLAKGTFYYHFKSKDELLIAVCERIVSDLAEQLKHIRNMNNKSVYDQIDALRQMLYDTFHNNQDIWFYIYQENNIILYDRTIRVSLNILGPIIANILEVGIKNGLLKMPHAAEAAEMILVMYDFYCKQYVGKDDPKKRERTRANLEYTMELLIGTAK